MNIRRRVSIIWILVFTGFAAFSQKTYTHFEIHKLSNGVFAAIHQNGGHAICNAGIIDLGDATLVFDPFLSLDAAEELKNAALELTGKPVRYVVNSHYHNDHIRGNQVFADAIIISSAKTKELIQQTGPDELENDIKSATENLETWKNKAVDSKDQHAMQEKLGMVGYYSAIAESAPRIKLSPPQVAFHGNITIGGNLRSVEITDMGAGHTESDAVMMVGEERILFAGDLLFVNTQPWMLDGNPDNWFRILERITDMRPEVIVPGHGPVSGTEAIEPMKSYMRTVLDNATRIAESGPNTKPMVTCPPPYDRWMLSVFYTPNVMGLSKRAKAAAKPQPSLKKDH